MGKSRRVWGGFNFSILVLMIILLLSTDQQCAAETVKKNKSISNQCGDSDKEECLLSDNVEMEFLLDSEASKRVFEASAATNSLGKYAVYRANDFGQAACDRSSRKPCLPNPNAGMKIPENCNKQSYNKACHPF